jgi:hypothetical protein
MLGHLRGCMSSEPAAMARSFRPRPTRGQMLMIRIPRRGQKKRPYECS